MNRPARVAAVTLSSLLLLLLPGPSQGAVVMTAEEQIVIQAHEVVEDDLVVWAPYVRVDGVVKGDLVALASELVVEGIVEQDLLAVAKTAYLNGSVNDDVRILAYAVALGENARVADDFFGLSYSLEAKPGSHVGGAVSAGSRQVLLAGQVVEEVLLRTGALELRGLTGGSVLAVVGGLEGFSHSSFVMDLAIEIPTVRDGITLSETAVIGGDLDYRAQEQAVIAADAQINGRVRHEPWQDDTLPIVMPQLERPGFGGDSVSEAVEGLAVLLILGLVLAVAAPRFLSDQGERVRSEPVHLLGWGIGAVVFTFLVSAIAGFAFLILMVLGLSTSFGGLAVTAIVAGALTQTALGAIFLIAIVYLSPVLASAGLGRAILERFRPSITEPVEAPVNAMLMIALGAATYAALRAIPWIGPVVGIAGALIGLGALASWLRERFAGD